MKLCAEKKLPEPRIEDVVELVPNKGPIGKSFKQGCILTGYLCCLLLFDTNKKMAFFVTAFYCFQEAKVVTDFLGALSADQIDNLEKTMEDKGNYDALVGDKTFCITKDMISKVWG